MNWAVSLIEQTPGLISVLHVGFCKNSFILLQDFLSHPAAFGIL